MRRLFAFFNDTYGRRLIGHFDEAGDGAVSFTYADDIAANIDAIRKDSTRWTDPRRKPRLSLGGTQGKFSLARVGDRWFWPTYEVPSTHIVKPPAERLQGIDTYEHAALLVARAAGVAASRSEILEVKGQRAFVVERWDRDNGLRLHAEDAAQGLGVSVDDKYGVSAPQVVGLLRAHGADPMPFVRQLAFNTYLGNADAHAKNYSVLLDHEQVVVAPLYDAVANVPLSRLRPTPRHADRQGNRSNRTQRRRVATVRRRRRPRSRAGKRRSSVDRLPSPGKARHDRRSVHDGRVASPPRCETLPLDRAKPLALLVLAARAVGLGAGAGRVLVFKDYAPTDW